MKFKPYLSLSAFCFVSTLNAQTRGLDIVLKFNDEPTASERRAFQAAESLWEGLITGHSERVSTNVLTIDVNLRADDGVGRRVGIGGPTSVHASRNFLFAETGFVTFDTADLRSLSLNGLLEDVIAHEIGHVLGIGTLWSSSAIGAPGFQELYVAGSGQYTGASGLANYNREFGQNGSFVPIELGGGEGTVDSHWNEIDGGRSSTGIVSQVTGRDLSEELLTGWLVNEAFVSSLTVGALEDLGFTVAAVAIPEPSLLGLGGLAFGLGLCRRNRRQVV